MAIVNQPQQDFISPSLVALTPLALYLERVKSVSDSIRFSNAGLDYLPLQFGGIKGQQESLSANSVVKIINFKISGNG